MTSLIDTVLLFVPAYLVLVHALRFRRVQNAQTELESALGGSYKRMNVDQAHQIFSYLSELEFPAIFLNATSFALFKTYGVPRISKLLVETGQLSSPTLSSKRAADTGALLMEIFCNAPSSSRSAQAIARINYLHGHYQRSGKILDDDMLYTLCLFALEPDRWVKAYEWRHLTDMELCALGTFWKSMGDAMSIPMRPLLREEDTSFTDGLDWYRKAKVWSTDYEVQNLRPAPTNRPLADSTLDIFLWFLPSALRGLGVTIVTCLLQQRLRQAMGYNEPPVWLNKAVHALLLCRKQFIRHLCLPRPEFMRCSLRPTPNEGTGRLHAATYILHPWYVRPTWLRRWGIEGWAVWVFGGALPGDAGLKYHPQGFDVTEVGPNAFRGKSAPGVEDSAERIRRLRATGCPFAIP